MAFNLQHANQEHFQTYCQVSALVFGGRSNERGWQPDNIYWL